jgi:NTE family protein
MRLAGTSAGAINTALMTVIGKKEDAKSLEILKRVCSLNFFDLVDGHPVAKRLIKNFITNADFSIKVKKLLIGIAITLGILWAGDFIFLDLQQKYSSLRIFTALFFLLTALLIVLLAILISYTASLFKKLKNSGYGINPGNYFFTWIKQQMEENGVSTVDDLNAKAGASVPGIHLRVPHDEGLNDLGGDVTFIASELATQNKIQFPGMCDLFRSDEDKNTLEPAGFVRASMAIPVFFESYFINNIPCNTQEMQSRWMEKFNEPDPPETARFVDGGILSDFPIDIFYKPHIDIPRMPVFGIDLDDSNPADKTKHAVKWSFLGYFSRIFNTVRFYYDKYFLLINKMFEKGIGKIPLPQYNWLNFFLKPEEKLDMLLIGAEAATDFLINFKWDDYKQARSDNNQILKQSVEKRTNP